MFRFKLLLFLVIFVTSFSCKQEKDSVASVSDSSPFQCPDGYIFISGNAHLDTDDFCVMKYEARVNGSNQLVYDVSQLPKTTISHTSAFNICQNHVNENFSGSFALISNPEWMTVAREIENQPQNWSSGTVGSGMLAKGHSDGIAFDYQTTQAFADVTNITDLTDYYNQTGNSASQPFRPDAGYDMEAYNSGAYDGISIYGWEQRRVHFLESGEVIWDFSGNASEFVDWNSSDEVYTYGPSDAGVSDQEVTDLFGSVLAQDLSPSGNYDSSYGMGKWDMLNDSSRGVVQRGGNTGEGSAAGIYFLSTTGFISDTGYPKTSFRCVYRP